MPSILYQDGLNAFNNKEYAQAETLFTAAIEQNPEITESILYLGQSQFFLGKENDAASHLKQYIKLNSHNDAAKANLACALDTLGQCFETRDKNMVARIYYRKATQIDNTYASAWHNLGLHYMKLSKNYLKEQFDTSLKFLEEAQTFLENALTYCQGNPVFLRSMASWHEQYIELLESNTAEQEDLQTIISIHSASAIDYHQQALDVSEAENSLSQANLQALFVTTPQILFNNRVTLDTTENTVREETKTAENHEPGSSTIQNLSNPR